MAAGTFKIVEENPNVTSGGGGCLCSEMECQDTEGPFVVFFATEMESVLSPTPVMCAGCVRQAAEDLETFEQDGELDL